MWVYFILLKWLLSHPPPQIGDLVFNRNKNNYYEITEVDNLMGENRVLVKKQGTIGSGVDYIPFNRNFFEGNPQKTHEGNTLWIYTSDGLVGGKKQTRRKSRRNRKPKRKGRKSRKH